MSIVYENVVKEIGSQVGAFGDEELIILFGDHAPDGLREYCHLIDVKPTIERIQVGQILTLGDKVYEITAVGNVVEKNLVELGHITIMFDGANEAALPGTLYVPVMILSNRTALVGRVSRQ